MTRYSAWRSVVVAAGVWLLLGPKPRPPIGYILNNPPPSSAAVAAVAVASELLVSSAQVSLVSSFHLYLLLAGSLALVAHSRGGQRETEISGTHQPHYYNVKRLQSANSRHRTAPNSHIQGGL